MFRCISQLCISTFGAFLLCSSQRFSFSFKSDSYFFSCFVCLNRLEQWTKEVCNSFNLYFTHFFGAIFSVFFTCTLIKTVFFIVLFLNFVFRDSVGHSKAWIWRLSTNCCASWKRRRFRPIIVVEPKANSYQKNSSSKYNAFVHTIGQQVQKAIRTSP